MPIILIHVHGEPTTPYQPLFVGDLRDISETDLAVPSADGDPGGYIKLRS